jgi:hypothetical protein
MNYIFNVGQQVMWSGGFGTQMPKLAKVVDLGEKNNKPVYDLDNGHWAYEYQLQNLNGNFPQHEEV